MNYGDILRRRARVAQEPRVLGKLTPYQIIGKPVITEKAYKMVEAINTYTFCIHKDAGKVDVKKSIESIYGVVPVSVRVVSVVSKGRNRRSLVRRAYKKAVVALKEGDKIELAG